MIHVFQISCHEFTRNNLRYDSNRVMSITLLMFDAFSQLLVLSCISDFSVIVDKMVLLRICHFHLSFNQYGPRVHNELSLNISAVIPPVKRSAGF